MRPGLGSGSALPPVLGLRAVYTRKRVKCTNQYESLASATFLSGDSLRESLLSCDFSCDFAPSLDGERLSLLDFFDCDRDLDLEFEADRDADLDLDADFEPDLDLDLSRDLEPDPDLDRESRLRLL